MSLGDSEVSICNRALSKIGSENRISALGEDGRAGEQCELLYSAIRDELLQAHPWNFAMARAALSLDAISPAFEYSNQFIIPADMLRAVELYNEREPFKIEGDRLLTNAGTANLKYIKRVTNPTVFSPLFCSTFVLKLGMALQNVIAGSTKIDDKEFEKTFREAKRRDGQEGTPDGILSTGPVDFKNGIFR